VFFEKDIDIIKKIYRFDNHAAYIYDQPELFSDLQIDIESG